VISYYMPLIESEVLTVHMTMVLIM